MSLSAITANVWSNVKPAGQTIIFFSTFSGVIGAFAEERKSKEDTFLNSTTRGFAKGFLYPTKFILRVPKTIYNEIIN